MRFGNFLRHLLVCMNLTTNQTSTSHGNYYYSDYSLEELDRIKDNNIKR